MKKLLVFLLIFVSCGGNELSEEATTVPETTTTPIPEATTTTLSKDVAFQNFKIAWEKNLKEPITLSLYEQQVAANFLYYWKWKGDKWTPENENFYELKVNGVSCYRIWNAMGSAWLDEVHPVGTEESYSKGYTAVERYMCEKDSIFEAAASLFGAPFFYKDAWWIYQDNQYARDLWDEIDCESPCASYVQNLATRVQIDLDDEIYSAYIPNPTEVEIEKYDKGWEEQLETFPVLTKEEFDKSLEFFLTYQLGRGNYPYAELKITVDNKNYICDRKSRGMVIPAFANEQHPFYLYLLEAGGNEEVDESIIGERDSVIIQGESYYRLYSLVLDYNCGVGDPYDSEDRLGLYGPLFFQDNQWWGFESYEDDYWEKSGKCDCMHFMKYFVKRVSLGSTLYDE